MDANVPVMETDEIKKVLTQKNDVNSVFQAVQSVRRLLSKERNPPIDSVIEMGLLPSLVTYLGCSEQFVLFSTFIIEN